MRGTARVEDPGGLRADRGRAEHARPCPHCPGPGPRALLPPGRLSWISRRGIPARPCLLPRFPVCSAQMQRDSEEDESSVRRRTFVGLTGASLFGAILADPARRGQADAIESFAAVLAAYSPQTAGPGQAARPARDSRRSRTSQARLPGLPVLRGTQGTSRAAYPVAGGLRRSWAARTGSRHARCPPKRTTSRPASSSKPATRAWHGSPPTAACRRPGPAKIP